MIHCAWKLCDAEEIASEELCCFLATLMHNELTALTLPPLVTSTTTPQMDFLYSRLALFCNPLLIAVGKAPKSLEELHKALCGVPILFDAIDTKCPSLKHLQIVSTSDGFNHFPLVASSSLGSSFCKVLSRLTILKLDCYKCDDWTLTQIASHATNLT
jgi:hypothetical protein